MSKVSFLLAAVLAVAAVGAHAQPASRPAVASSSPASKAGDNRPELALGKVSPSTAASLPDGHYLVLKRDGSFTLFGSKKACENTAVNVLRVGSGQWTCVPLF